MTMKTPKIKLFHLLINMTLLLIEWECHLRIIYSSGPEWWRSWSQELEIQPKCGSLFSLLGSLSQQGFLKAWNKAINIIFSEGTHTIILKQTLVSSLPPLGSSPAASLASLWGSWYWFTSQNSFQIFSVPVIETVRKSGYILISMLFIERNLRISKVINSTHFKQFTKSCTMCLVTDLSSKSEILFFSFLCLLKYRLICIIKESGVLTSNLCPHHAETVKHCQEGLTHG